jgi:hypothetical protein
MSDEERKEMTKLIVAAVVTTLAFWGITTTSVAQAQDKTAKAPKKERKIKEKKDSEKKVVKKPTEKKDGKKKKIGGKKPIDE